MNILGIGPAEIIIVVVMMLIIAGPKRMVQWSYIAGQYIAQLREMWQETSAVIRKELEQAGLEPDFIDSMQKDLTNPRQLRNRANPLKQVSERAAKEISKPFEDVLDEADIRKDILPEQQSAESPDTGEASGNGNTPTEPATPATTDSASSTPAEPTTGRYDAWTPN